MDIVIYIGLVLVGIAGFLTAWVMFFYSGFGLIPTGIIALAYADFSDRDDRKRIRNWLPPRSEKAKMIGFGWPFALIALPLFIAIAGSICAGLYGIVMLAMSLLVGLYSVFRSLSAYVQINLVVFIVAALVVGIVSVLSTVYNNLVQELSQDEQEVIGGSFAVKIGTP